MKYAGYLTYLHGHGCSKSGYKLYPVDNGFIDKIYSLLSLNNPDILKKKQTTKILALRGMRRVSLALD